MCELYLLSSWILIFHLVFFLFYLFFFIFFICSIFLIYCIFFFFFFQAEDGIRDKLVTGVQTCALPICGPLGAGRGDGAVRRRRPRPSLPAAPATRHRRPAGGRRADLLLPDAPADPAEIGRASCRERV